MRYERKYRIEHNSLSSIRQLLELHPAAFRSLYPDRQINNIYLDSPGLDSWKQNVAGINERKKFRIRWYGEELSMIKDPRLEIKIKHNELGEKESFAVDSFSIDELPGVLQKIAHHHPEFPYLHPSMLNTYVRSYLISFDGRFRLTIDREMMFYPIYTSGLGWQKAMQDTAIILEVKYDSVNDQWVDMITQALPFRQSKHSKYVHGLQLCR